ncbi:MAG: hypothetical protein AB7K09_15540 [Planctomycetota bacterium]
MDNLVLQRGDSQRPFLAIGLGNEHATNRLCPERSSSQSIGQIPQVARQVLPVLLPRQAIYAGRCCPLQVAVGSLQIVESADVVKSDVNRFFLSRSATLRIRSSALFRSQLAVGFPLSVSAVSGFVPT